MLCFAHAEFSSIIIGTRVGKNIFSETDSTIQRYIDTLDTLMQNFRDQTNRDVAIFVHRTGKDSNVLFILIPSYLIPLQVMN
jgi:hypothetical protein